jgi:hypothetical protein
MRTSGRRKIVIFPILIALAVMAYQFFTAEKFVNPETGRKSEGGVCQEGQEPR